MKLASHSSAVGMPSAQILNRLSQQVAGASDVETTDGDDATTRASVCLCDPEAFQAVLPAYDGQELRTEPSGIQPNSLDDVPKHTERCCNQERTQQRHCRKDLSRAVSAAAGASAPAAAPALLISTEPDAWQDLQHQQCQQYQHQHQRRGLPVEEQPCELCQLPPPPQQPAVLPPPPPPQQQPPGDVRSLHEHLPHESLGLQQQEMVQLRRQQQQQHRHHQHQDQDQQGYQDQQLEAESYASKLAGDLGTAAPEPGPPTCLGRQKTTLPPPPSPPPPVSSEALQGQGQGQGPGPDASGREDGDGADEPQPKQVSQVASTLASRSSSGAWVDTATLWNNVQRKGEELQRRRRLAQAPASASCIGADWARGPRRLLQRARTQLIVTSRVAAKDPCTVIIPLLLLVCMLAFGLWGVFSVSYAIRDGRRQAALNAALDYSNTLKSHIAATVTPASTLKTLIQRDPTWDSIKQTFYEVAPDLVQKGRQSDAVITIVLAPQGIAQAIVPQGLPGWDQVVGLDLLRNKSWRGDALKTIKLHEQGMVMTGPSKLRAGPMGIVCRYAVFIPGAGPEDTFGFNGSAYNCSDVCYVPGNQTSPSKRFWGFAQLNVDWEVLVHNVTHIDDLCKRDSLAFNMTYIDPVTFKNRSIANCSRVGSDPVVITITTMQNTWVLAVSDTRGWVPDWTPLVLAAVVVVSLWISITMAIILINRREHMWLLQAMLPKKVIATLRRGEEYAEAFECVTILFSDIVSYTTLASELEPIKVVRLLNEMYSAFDDLVDRYECYKVETIGDAFMAVCGTQGEDAVAAAVKMAKLAQAMVDRTRVLVSEDGQKIQIRIGLHSGPVVGAVVGFKMPHFCLCGDTVNTASRMESNSRPMSIHVSDVTAQLLLASNMGFRVEPRGLIDVKGKGRMFTHWLLPPEAGGAKLATEPQTPPALAVAVDAAAAAAASAPAALSSPPEAAEEAASPEDVGLMSTAEQRAPRSGAALWPLSQSASGAILPVIMAAGASGSMHGGAGASSSCLGTVAVTTPRPAPGTGPGASGPVPSPAVASPAGTDPTAGSGLADGSGGGAGASAGNRSASGIRPARVGSGGRSVSMAGASMPTGDRRRCSELGEAHGCARHGFSFLPRCTAIAQSPRGETGSGTGSVKKGRGTSVDLRLFQPGSPAPRSKG